MFSRSVPQQIGQMSPATPGQYRRGRRVLQIAQGRWVSAMRSLSQRRLSWSVMARTDLYIKVTVDHDRDESPDRLGREICRQVEKVYGVRTAEVQNFVTRNSEA